MYHSCHRRTSWGGGTRIWDNSFHFVGTDNDKIKIVGGNIIGKKTFHMWENIIVSISIFLEISEILISSWIFKKSKFQLLVYGEWEMGSNFAYRAKEAYCFTLVECKGALLKAIK